MNEHELRGIIDRLPTAVVAVDRDLRVAFANAPAMRLFRPVPLRTSRRLPDAPFDPELHAFTRGLFERRLGPEVRLVSTEGTAYSILGVPPHDRPYASLFIDDVSDRTRVDQAREEFLANAAHELLTPLTGIVSVTHVLEAGAKDVPEMRDRFLAHIARECNRLTRIARSLLVLARSRSGAEPPRPEYVELHSVIEDAVEGAGGPADMRIDCATDLRVFVDPDLVELALANLIANALRHSDSEVAVAAHNGAGGVVDVFVSGLGTDLRAEDVDRLRQRFVSGSGRDGGGFGLGISIATQALESVGGRLTFEFNADGSHAHVELPAGIE